MEISGGVQDEIKAHLDGWFIGPTEACWKIFEFNMHGVTSCPMSSYSSSK